MKRRRILGVVTIIGALVSCKSTKMPSNVYNLDQHKTALTVNAAVSDTLTFMMEGNLSTGYNWSSNIDTNNTSIKIVKDTYEEIGPAKPAGFVGAPSNKVFQYVPLKAGEYTIHFEYKRGWETTPPIKQKTVILKVN